jgi:hypothetical protein
VREQLESELTSEARQRQREELSSVGGCRRRPAEEFSGTGRCTGDW